MSDQVKNFAYGTLSSGISAAATSFSLQSGEGARFPATASGEFNVCIYDSIYPSAAVAYQNSAGEIVRVTTRATDTFTVTRAQEGTSAVAFNTTGRTYRVEMNVTAKNFEEASSTLSGLVSTSAQTFAGQKTFPNNIILGVSSAGGSSATNATIRMKNNSSATYVTDVVAGVLTADVITTLPASTGTVANLSQVKSILAWCQAGNYNPGSTNYITFGLSTTTQSADNYKISLPACTVSELRVFSSANTLNGDCVFTVRQNGSDTALACTAAASTATAQNLSNIVSFASSDEISVKLASAGSSGTMNNISITVVLTLF